MGMPNDEDWTHEVHSERAKKAEARKYGPVLTQAICSGRGRSAAGCVKPDPSRVLRDAPDSTCELVW